MQGTDFFWPYGVYLYIPPPTRYLHRSRSYLKFFPLRLSRFYDPCLESAIDSIILAGLVALAYSYSVYSPRLDYFFDLRTQLKHTEPGHIDLGRQVSYSLGLPQWTITAHISSSGSPDGNSP
jgi:hypothetical protein